MNSVIMNGRLAAEPVKRSAGSNSNGEERFVTNLRLAVERPYRRNNDGNGPDADFFNISVFGGQADACEKYLHKGSRCIVSGRIQNDSYTNKDGNKVYTTNIIASRVEFIDTKAESEALASAEAAAPAPDAAQTPEANEGFMEFPDDEELPFA